MKGLRLFGLGIVLGGSMLLSSCSVFFGDDAKAVEESEAEETRVPDTLMRSFVRTAHDAKGRILWQIKAREGRVFNDVNRIYLTDFILYSFAEDGTLRSTFRARRGVMDNNSGITTGKLNVVLRAENGRVLETSEVHANNNDKIIYNDVLNRITQEDGTVMIGTHLWAHSDLKVFKLRGTKGEAPEGAGDGIFGESSASASASASSRSAGGVVRSSAAPVRGSSASQASAPARSAGSRGSASSSSDGWHMAFPEIGLDELERIRMEIAFPKSASSSARTSSSSSSSSVSNTRAHSAASLSSGRRDERGTNS